MKWFIVLLLLSSCTAMKSKNSGHQVSIHDLYVLTEVAGESVKGKITKQSTLEINLTDMRIMGVDGCNEFSGNISHYDASKTELSFDEMVATEMYCDELSNKVGKSLYKVKKYVREGMLLKLISEHNEVLLIYKKVD